MFMDICNPSEEKLLLLLKIFPVLLNVISLDFNIS